MPNASLSIDGTEVIRKESVVTTLKNTTIDSNVQFPAGMVLQTVALSSNTLWDMNITTTFSTIHGSSNILYLPITPKRADSNLLLNWSINFNNVASTQYICHFRLHDVTNNTNPDLGDAGNAGNRHLTTLSRRFNTYDANSTDQIQLTSLVSASNTNARTYRIEGRTEQGNRTLKFNHSTNNNNIYGAVMVSYAYAMEIAA